MLVFSNEKLNELLNKECTVYTKEYLHEGCECFTSNESFGDKSYYVTNVKAKNIKSDNNRFYYTEEEFNGVADYWPPQLISVIGAFSSKRKGKLCKSCLVDISGMPAFNVANEDIVLHEYRFYITLFNDFTVKQCQFERHELYDAKFKSSKYDLISKMQNTNCLQSKDFKVINYRREKEETVPVGLIIRESESRDYNIDYGTVYIDMNNRLSIKWH